MYKIKNQKIRNSFFLRSLDSGRGVHENSKTWQQMINDQDEPTRLILHGIVVIFPLFKARTHSIISLIECISFYFTDLNFVSFTKNHKIFDSF